MAYKRNNVDKSVGFALQLDEKQIKELNAKEINNEAVLKLYVDRGYDAKLVEERIFLISQNK